MHYKKSQIVADTRTLMRLSPCDSPLIDCMADSPSINIAIEANIQHAIRAVYESIPTEEFLEPRNFDPAVCPNASGIFWNASNCKLHSGRVALPGDFLKLARFRMDDWDTAICSAITPADSEYWLQHSPYLGLRGNPQRPVCAIAPQPEGLCLEFYSCRSKEAQIAEALYIPCPEFDSHGLIEISEQLYDKILRKIVALTTSDNN